jgi:hypothetical protein
MIRLRIKRINDRRQDENDDYAESKVNFKSVVHAFFLSMISPNNNESPKLFWTVKKISQWVE